MESAVINADGTPDSAKSDEVLGKKRRLFRAYEENKRREIEEQREHRRYYFDKQWTEDQEAKLEARGQPATVRNRIKRKVDFLVGIEQRMRRDPKAYPRNPQDEKSADVATAALRFACEINRWEQHASLAAHHGLVSGVGLIYIGGQMTQRGADVKLQPGQVDRFFYDPRSIEADFSDAQYMGLHLWLDIEDAVARWPDKKGQLRELMGANAESTSALAAEDDRDEQWGDHEHSRVRVVEFWQRIAVGPDKFAWTYCFFSGSILLDQGPSPFIDSEGLPDCPYIAWSPYVDHRGDRHGIVRSMKSVQDAINHRASKIQHRLATRQFFYRTGAVDDVDKFAQELARPDGKIEINGEWGVDVGLIDQSQSIKGEYELLNLDQSEIENLGPNPGLVGKGGGVADQSGRAILAQRDSGMTELSPVFDRLRDWKLRVYHKIWDRIRQYWKEERYIRITDNPDAPGFIGVNQYGMDPMSGQIHSNNVLAQVDVDIILEEGPDTITMQDELLERLSQLGEVALSPLGKVMIELSGTPNKERLIQMLDEAQAPPPEQQPDPRQEVLFEQELAGNAAKIREIDAKTAKTNSEVGLNQARAFEQVTRAQQNLTPDLPV